MGQKVLPFICFAILETVVVAVPGFSQDAASPAQVPSATAPDKAQNQLDFADGQYQRNLFLGAAEEYARFIETYPDHEKIPVALFRRAECLYQASYKDPAKRADLLKQAEETLRTLLERYPQNERRTEALLRRGEILCHLDRATEASPLLSELLKTPLAEKVEEAVRFHLGQAYYAEGKIPLAEKEWETLRQKFPKGNLYAPATYSLALVKKQKSQPDTTIALLNELIAANPPFPIPENSPIPGDSRILLAQIYTQMGDHARAATLYEEASREPRHRINALYLRAWSLFQQQNFPDTIDLTQKLLEEPALGDYQAGVLFLLGTSLYETKNYKKAIEPLQRVSIHPKAAEFRTQAWYRLVWALFLTEDYEGAKQQALGLLKLKLDPALAGDVHFLLGQIAASAKQYSEAAVEYRTVVEQFPASRFIEKANYGVGEMEYSSQAFDRAAQGFSAFLKAFPESTLYNEALRWLAESLLQSGQAAEAAQRFTELIQRCPEHPEMSRFLYLQGLALHKSDQKEAMRKPLEDLLQRFPKSPDAHRALYWLAWQDDEAGNKERALQEYERLLKEYPESEYAPTARRRLAIGNINANRFDLALPMLLEVLANAEEAKKVGPEIFFRMAIYASDQGKHDEALAILNRVSEVHPQPEVIERSLIEQGREAVVTGQWTKATAQANEFFDKFPHSQYRPEGYWIRARALQGLNQFDDAEHAFQEGLAALANLGSPDPVFEATVHLDWAKLLEARSRPEEALKEYLYVDILFPGPKTSPEALLHASICQEQLGQIQEAKATLQRLVDLFPNTPEAQKAIQRLQEFGKSAE